MPFGHSIWCDLVRTPAQVLFSPREHCFLDVYTERNDRWSDNCVYIARAYHFAVYLVYQQSRSRCFVCNYGWRYNQGLLTWYLSQGDLWLPHESCPDLEMEAKRSTWRLILARWVREACHLGLSLLGLYSSRWLLVTLVSQLRTTNATNDDTTNTVNIYSLI